MEIAITVTEAQATMFMEALAYWNAKTEQSIDYEQKVLELAEQFCRDYITAKRIDDYKVAVETELDLVWD